LAYGVPALVHVLKKRKSYVRKRPSPLCLVLSSSADHAQQVELCLMAFVILSVLSKTSFVECCVLKHRNVNSVVYFEMQIVNSLEEWFGSLRVKIASANGDPLDTSKRNTPKSGVVSFLFYLEKPHVLSLHCFEGGCVS